MARITLPSRTRALWLRLGQRMRCWLVSYASVAAITIELLSEKPASTGRSGRPPLVAAARETRVNGCWDPAELLEGTPDRVILASAPPISQSTGNTTMFYWN